MTNAVGCIPVAMPDFHVEFYQPGYKSGKKHKIVIDVCRFVQSPWAGKDDEYEVMTMFGDGVEIESFRTMSCYEAEQRYARMVAEHCPESWKNLIADLKSAKAIAQAADGNDGGTCNFDSPALSIPEGMKYEHVKACCAAAGVRCFDWKPLGTGPKLAVLSSCAGNGQGNRRTKGAEAACKFLNERGYNCGMYYQMD